VKIKAIIARAGALLDAVPLSIIQLMARVAVGSVFFDAGLTKIESWQSTVVLFRDEYRVPFIPLTPGDAADAGAGVGD